MAGKLIVFLTLLLCWSAPALAGEIRIFAAASLNNAMKEICLQYKQKHPGIVFVENYAGSGTLARQVDAGAPADLFVSANPRWIDYLRGRGLLAPETIGVLTHNELVFVARKETAASSLAETAHLQRIAIGSPNSVPAGDYARQALEGAGLYENLAAAGALVFAKDVRQALMYADRGEVDGAFVYRTDALLARQATVRFVVPAGLYPRVTYPMALTATGANNPEAQAFIAYLNGDEARTVLEKHGFAPM
jgi:molybdate transport system substrate-binding protein